MDLEMARRMERYRRDALTLGPDTQGDLLGHCPAGQKDRGLFAQQRRDVALEVVDEATLAVAVGLFVGAGLCSQVGQDRAWPLRPMAKQEALAL
jgi:hypothetical protein